MKRTFLIVAVVVLIALILRFVFDLDTMDAVWNLMSLSFFIGLPYLVGVLSIYLSSIEKVRSRIYQAFFPWLPIFAFFIVTLVLAIEGWACWAMILPLFLLFSTLGGLTAGYFR